MFINIRESSDSIFSVELDKNKTIKDLKAKIEKQFNIPEFCQKLFYKGTELLNDKYFSEYNINVDEFIDLINYNDLKTTVSINKQNIRLICYLKASDTIKKIKEEINKSKNIPIDKIEVLKSQKVIEDNRFIEDFIDDLNFYVNLLETEKIKLYLIDENKKETMFVDPFSTVGDIQKQLKKDFDYKFKYKGKFMKNWDLLIQYNIKNNDTIELMKLSGKIGVNIMLLEGTKICAYFFLEDKVSELNECLASVTGERHYTFRFDGERLREDKTFSFYGIEDEDIIVAGGRVVGGCINVLKNRTIINSYQLVKEF